MTEGTVGSGVPGDSVRRNVVWGLAPLAVAGGSLALGAVALGSRSLTSDEAAASGRANASLGDLLSTIAHDAPDQVGNLLALKLATLVGADEMTLRAPAAIAVALAAGLLVILAGMLLGRVGGLVAGIALATNAGVVDASREARPYALGILGIVLATLLLVVALERGGGWRWAPYAVAAAALPLFHPLAASALAAHGAMLIARRDRADLRAAGIALLAGTAFAMLLLAWMAVDRFDSPAGVDALDLSRLGHGLATAGGWNLVLAAGAVAGLAFLFNAAHASAPDRWVGVLVAALIAAPVAATLLAALAMPVHAGALVLAAPGIALAVGAAAPLLSPTRGLVAAGTALLVVASTATITTRLTRPVDEDWRSLAAAVRSVRGAKETVVVIPASAREAFAYYAPYERTMVGARGDGAWIAVVAGSANEAIEASRPHVVTPRYALLRQFRYGERLRLQHWVRP